MKKIKRCAERSIKHKMIAAVCVLAFLITGCGRTEGNVSTPGQGTGGNSGLVNGDPETGGAETGGAGTSSSIPGGSSQGGSGASLDSDAGGSSEGKDVSWQARYFPLENQYSLGLIAEELYGCYIKDGKVLLDRINRDSTSDCETLALPDVSLMAGIGGDSEGNVYLLGNKGESTGLWKIDPEGNLQDYGNLELEDTEQVEDLRMKGVFTDEKGHLFIWCEMTAPGVELINGRENEVWHWEDRVYVKDGQLKTVFYEKIEDMKGTQVLSFQLGVEGEPVFVVKDSDGIYMQEIDVDRKGKKEAVRLEEFGDFLSPADAYSLENIVPVQNGFMYCLENVLYECHFDTQKTEKLFSLSTYGIISQEILFLRKNGDVIEIIDNHGDAGHSELITLALGKTEKQIVTLGSTAMVPDLENAVAEFNRFSGEYRVELVDYVALKGSYEGAAEQLRLDVITGKAPDIITTEGMDYSIFSDKGVLADLYELMEKDGEFSKEMLVPSVAGALEDDGHLYSIAPSFLLHSVWGYGDVIKGKTGVTFEELFRLLEESGKDINAITGFSADEPVLTRLCTVSMDEFVDWEKGTCSFNGEYFKQALSFVKEYTGKDAEGTYAERIRKRETVMTVGLISSVADYQIQKELYGGDLDFIGYPVAEGSGTAVGFMGSAVGINARKEDLAGAWEFVKYYLLHGYDGQGFPVLQEQFDKVLADAMEEDYDTSEDGGAERYPKGYYGDGVISFSVYAAAKEDVDAVKALVESAENRVRYHAAIQNIINEEAGGYFSGQVDLESTVDKIQNRVALILQESQ